MRPSHYHSRTRDELTERQRDVLRLIAKDKTNPQIADALGMTLDGAKFHVSEILTKLDVSTREEAAAWWREQRSLRQRAARSLRVLWAAPVGRIVVAGSGLALAAAVAGGIFFIASGRDQSSSREGDLAFVFQVNDTLDGPTEVVTYDASRHEIAGRFPVTRADAQADGSDIFTGLQQRTLNTASSDGLVTPLYTAPAGEQVQSVAVSPDGRTLALEQLTDQAGADDDAVVLLNLADHRVLHRFRVSELVPEVPSATIADGFRWNGDSQAVTIQLPLPGASNVPYPQMSQAVVLGVDGSVRKVPLGAMAIISPDGSMVAEGAPIAAGCVGFGGTHGFRIVDLHTGKTLASVNDASTGLRGFAWMPDGSGFVYLSSAETGCAPGGSDSTWWLLPASGKARQIPGDPSSQMSDAVAARISWSCPGGTSQHFGEGVIDSAVLSGEMASCTPLGGPLQPPGGPTPTPRTIETADLTVDGHHVLDAFQITLIGQITLP